MKQKVEVSSGEQITKLQEEKLVAAAHLEEANAFLERNEDLLEQRKVELEKAAEEKRILNNRIREMERKLLNSEKHGGVAAIASLKERKLHKKLEKLSKRLHH